MNNESLHTKYRPSSFEEVLGQDAAVSAIQKALNKKSQAFLFSGPAGTGKTTLARIVAAEAGCGTHDIVEVPAAVNTGVDAMRAIGDMMQYRPMGKGASRAVILDECHRLTGNAWDSLLKVTEEPPSHCYWFLCTTNPSKVPPTIKTRFTSVALKLVDDENIRALIEWVIGEEGMEVGPDAVSVVVKEAHGSPRQALVNLAMCDGISSRKEAADILRAVLDSDATIELCRFLMSGGSWAKAMAIVAKLEGENPEGVRIIVCNYVAAALKGASSDQKAAAMLGILDAFSEPYTQSDQLAPLMLSIGRALFNRE